MAMHSNKSAQWQNVLAPPDRHPWPSGVPRVINICYKLPRIPRLVHSRWRALNPGFWLAVHGDDDCREFLRDAYGEEAVRHFRGHPEVAF